MSENRFELFHGLITDLAKGMQKLKNKKMEAYGLGTSHTMCLVQLSECHEGMTKAELSKRGGVDRAHVTRIVNELIQKGYVRMNETVGYKYKKKVFLTDRGQKVATDINEVVKNVVDFVKGGISEEEMQELYALLTRINLNLKKAEDVF